MPGSTKKTLYIAANLTDLNSKTGDNVKVKEGQCRMYAKSSEKVYKNAEESELLGDEERAYVLFMKFLNILQGVRKTAEYKKNKKFYDDLIGVSKLTTALTQAEQLSTSLQQRYEEKEAEEVSKKLENLDREKKSDPIEDDIIDDLVAKDGEKVEEENKEPTRDEKLAKKGFMSCEKLYSLMYDQTTSFVMMDVRPSDQFVSSHINYRNCVNIPTDIIHAGCTVRHLEGKIPADSRETWDRRGNVDFIILLDWTCSEKDLEPKSTICSLKDAIYKWDQETVIKSQPLVLEGGYEEWLNMYPTLTTNPSIPRPPSYSTVANNTVSLETIDYDLDLNFLKTEAQLAEEERAKNYRNNMVSANNHPLMPSGDSGRNNMPVVPDRSSKPVPNNRVIPTNTRQGDKLNKINNDLSKDFKGMSLSDMKKNLDSNDVNVHPPPPVKNVNIVNENNKRDQNNAAVEMKKVTPMPSVDRRLKPKPAVNGVNGTTGTDNGVQEIVDMKKSENVVSETHREEIIKPPTEDPQITKKLNESKAEVEEIHRQQETKQAEFIAYKTENKRLILETEARRAKLNKEKQELEKVNAMKSKAKEETDEMERKLEEMRQEMEQLERQKEQRATEENRRKAEIERLKQTEEEKKAKLKQETERLREERKRKEDAEAARQKAETDRLALEEQRKQELAQQQEQKRKDLEDRLAHEAQMKKAQAAREAEITKAQEGREARARADREKKEGEERRQREEAERKAAEAGKASPAPMLPVGWERRWDATSKKYYYINHHTKNTQWEVPSVAAKSKGLYKAKLKTEDDVSSGSGGLKRSHSSPNIAKMMQDEEERKAQPSVNRFAKPQQTQSNRALDIQKHRFSEAKVRNFNPIWGSVSHGLTGLKNQGNTCYMNSTLQCLSNTGFLTTYLLTGNYRPDINVNNKFGTRGEIAEEYAALVSTMWSGQYRSITPRDFKLSCARQSSTFSGFDQQDSQELLSYLLDWLHEDLNKVPQRKILPEQQNDDIPEELAAQRAWEMHKSCHNSVIVHLFQGQLKSTVTCKVCSKKSVTFDTFMFLSLDIPSQSKCSIRECLQAFSKEEKMTGDSRWNCPRCRMKREATKRIVIWKLPPILIIVLKRFYQSGMWRQKNSAYVDFPVENVDFNGFVAGPKHERNYNLYAMSNHFGTMEGGHYTAYCKNPKLDRWFKFDDQEVYEYSKSDIKSSAAYFLFYSSVKESS